MSPRRAALADRADSLGIPAADRPSPVDVMVAPAIGTPTSIPVALIDPHPDNPREELELDDEFVESIRTHGVLQAITVVTSQAFWAARGVTDTVDAGRYVVLMGHRRRGAAEKAGQLTVPAVVRDELAGDDASVVMLIENLHRKDLSPIEEARGYVKLRDQYGLDQEAIGVRVKRSQSHIAKRISLLNLPDDIQRSLTVAPAGDGEDKATPKQRLAVTEAYELSKYADEPDVIAAAKKRPSWQTVDQVAREVRKARDRKAKIAKKKAELTAKGARKVVNWPGHMYSDLAQRVRYGRGPMRLADLEKSGADVRDHQALPCHATAVGFTSSYSDKLEVAVVCTKPQNHAEHLTKKEEDKAAREQREADKAAEAAATRREFARAMVAGKPTKELVALVDELVLDRLFAGFNRPAEISALADLLGLHGESTEVVEEINKMAKGAAPQRQRLIHAVAIAKVDLDIDRPHGDHAGAGTYLRWLQSQGHNLVGVERKLAGRKS